MKKITAELLSLIMALAVCAGCSDSGSSKTASESKAAATQPAESAAADEKKAAALDEPDFMGFLVGDGSTEFIGMSESDFNNAAGGKFTKENAADYNNDFSDEVTAAYSLGSKDTMLGGRVSLGKAYDLSCVLQFKNDKLTCAKLRIDKLTKDEADKIAQAFLDAFEGKLPEGYTQFKPVEHGKKKEVGFSKTADDYIISVTRDENLSGDTYLFFAIQNYAERYGMNK